MTPPDAITLRDDATGSTAAILPSLGFNCFSFRPVVAGHPIETLWTTPDFGALGTRPTRSGIPLLFPFGGRIRGQSFTYDGRTYPLTLAQRNNGNAIHGFVVNRPWRVIEQTATRAVGEFHAATDEPALLDQWPADFRLIVAYELAGPALQIAFRVDNPSERPLPFALGAHPYFRVPLGSDNPADCRITVPATDYWELADLVPTGKHLPVDARRNLTAPKRFADADLDDVLTGLLTEGGRVRTVVDDPTSGRTLTQEFDPVFAHCVVFTPPHREAIAIEPYTTLPNPFALEAGGIRTGLQVLPPGASFTARVDLRVD